MSGPMPFSPGRSWPTVVHRIHRLLPRSSSIICAMATVWVNPFSVRIKCTVETEIGRTASIQTSSLSLCVLVFNWLRPVGRSERICDRHFNKYAIISDVICSVQHRSTIPIWTTLISRRDHHRRSATLPPTLLYPYPHRASLAIRTATVMSQPRPHHRRPCRSASVAAVRHGVHIDLDVGCSLFVVCVKYFSLKYTRFIGNTKRDLNTRSIMFTADRNRDVPFV